MSQTQVSSPKQLWIFNIFQCLTRIFYLFWDHSSASPVEYVEYVRFRLLYLIFFFSTGLLIKFYNLKVKLKSLYYTDLPLCRRENYFFTITIILIGMSNSDVFHSLYLSKPLQNFVSVSGNSYVWNVRNLPTWPPRLTSTPLVLLLYVVRQLHTTRNQDHGIVPFKCYPLSIMSERLF